MALVPLRWPGVCAQVPALDKVQTTAGCRTEPGLDCTTTSHLFMQTNIGSFRPISVVLIVLIAWWFSLGCAHLWGPSAFSVGVSAIRNTKHMGNAELNKHGYFLYPAYKTVSPFALLQPPILPVQYGEFSDQLDPTHTSPLSLSIDLLFSASRPRQIAHKR